MISEASLQVAPSVLAADFSNLGQQVREVTDAGADQIHVDVMDGQFVPNISFGEAIVDAIRRSTHLPLDIHLMIAQPDNLLPGFMKAAADQITVHAEACRHLHGTVTRIKGEGNRVGVAINPGTPISAVEEVLPLLDTVLVMTVNPGFGGQSFISQALDKVKRLRRIIDGEGLNTRIEVDGGVKADWTAQESVRAGATVLVSGTGIFNQAETVAQAMGRMRTCIRGLKPAWPGS
jgi:ribulose-phosphate 3-epimerase